MNNNLGRDKLPWKPELWNRIDQAVHAEVQRISIARKFLPIVPLADALTAPADKIEAPKASLLTVEEGRVVPLIEIWVEFALTAQQVEGEAHLSTAVTLATRATNLLIQAEDLLMFQGNEVIKKHELFIANRVHHRAGPAGDGLTNRDVLPEPEDQILPVTTRDPVEPGESTDGKYGENTFAQVAEGYSRLQKEGHYGPYALVLHTVPFADTHAPLKSTLIMPADRIKPLMKEGFFGTGTLPPFTGLLLSLGGNTMDLVCGMDTTAAFVQEDNEGRYRFRVFERFALRDKDRSGRIILEFCHTEPRQNN